MLTLPVHGSQVWMGVSLCIPLEKEVATLHRTPKYTFEVMLLDWFQHSAAVRHPDISKILNIAALIPSSTAEVEKSFSLMKLISTRLRNRLNQENLGRYQKGIGEVISSKIPFNS